MIGVVLALPIAARAASLSGEDLFARALKAAGGRERLSRVKALRWNGAARIETPGKSLLLEVETRVEPFFRARSRSWLAGKPETARTLLIEPDGGFVERGGVRAPLPERQTLHERQQYGLYGYMLLARAPTRTEGAGLVAERPGLPPIRFLLEGDYLAAADYVVAAPDGDGTVRQRILLEGDLRDQGIRWPQTITILHDDAPYFTLDIQTFSVELA
jgi:hypothetical protein